MYSSAVFAEGRPLCTQILPGQGRLPATILDIRKLETLDYPMVEIASPSAFPRFETIAECDGQRDRQSDGQTIEFDIAYTGTAFAKLHVALRRPVVNRRRRLYILPAKY